MTGGASIEERIIKDLRIFEENIRALDRNDLPEAQVRILELAEMYAKDSRAFLGKKDYYTSFSAIAYAHGLLDSIRKLNGKSE